MRMSGALTHSTAAVQSDHERRVICSGDPICQTRPVDIHKLDHF